MRAQSLFKAIVRFVVWVPLVTFGMPTTPASAQSEASDAAQALDMIQKLASLHSLAPDRVRKELRARVTIRQTMWTKDPGVGWGLYYQLNGDFGALQPDNLNIRPAPPFDRANPAAIITLRFTIDGKTVCISPDDLSAKFDHKLTEPKFPERPYEFRDCVHNNCAGTRGAPQHFILEKSPNLAVVFGYYANNCLDEIVLTETGLTAPKDAERRAFEFITPAMNIADAKAALGSRGFYCDPKMIAGPRPGNDAFSCEIALPPNDAGFKSQSVEIWQDPDGKNITGVLIANWREPAKELKPNGT